MTAPTLLLEYFGKEAVEYLGRLEHLARSATGAPPEAATMLAQARALHGSATLTSLEGLPEATAALERLLRGVQEGGVQWDDALRAQLLDGLQGLRGLVAEVGGWGAAARRAAHDVVVRLSQATVQALAAPVTGGGEGVRILPIARLYPDDGAPGILHRAATPPTTVARRFRDEVAAAAAAVGAESARLQHDGEGTRFALRLLAEVADSYGAASIAQLAARMARAPLATPDEREAVLRLAALLQQRALSEPQLAQAVREAVARFAEGAQAEPAAGIVPIETLLYRGHAALSRAREVRDALRGHWHRGTLAEPAAHALFEELSELLDLAGTA
ncbi:MAG: hypothetical protein KJT01_15315 [Gemmatimonadetes bacterium]|nr:hypothetical protein [Gemmatimonadota bacterium]